MRLHIAVARDLASDLRARSRHAAHINEGDWSALDDAANDLDAAADRSEGPTVEVPDAVREIAESEGLL